MNSRLVACLALVALALCSGAHALVAETDASLDLQKGADVDLPAGQLSSNGHVIMTMAGTKASADVDATIDLQRKGDDTDLPAGELSNTDHVIMNMANPSAPPKAKPNVLLSLPRLSVDLGVSAKKVPLLSMADAPCKKICKDKCEIKMEKTCLNITLPKKECKINTKTITKKFCEKRCKPSLELQLPAFKLPKLPTTVNPNPSTPPATNPSTPPAALQAADSQDDSKASAVGSAVGALTNMNADKLPSADLNVECHDVCVEVPIVMPEVKCSASSKVVKKCTFVPEKSCKEHCVCLAQKSLTLSLPKKPSLAVSASVDSKVDT